jgi:hypothetical protein
MVNNDAAATLAATAACLLLWRLAGGGDRISTAAVAGLVAGLAISTKWTAAFLVPMAAAAVACQPGTARRARAAGWISLGLAAGAGWVFARNLWVFGDPLAREFKRDILGRSGFAAIGAAPPGPLDPAFWTAMRLQVFEAFWARFGSLGAGPDAGSRVWLLYGAMTAALIVLLAIGLLAAVRQPASGAADGGPAWRVTLTAAIATLSALALWVFVNLVPQADIVVHWTPRHLLPATAPLLLLTALGLQRLRAGLGGPAAAWRSAGLLVLFVLVTGWLVALRHAIQQFYFGY